MPGQGRPPTRPRPPAYLRAITPPAKRGAFFSDKAAPLPNNSLRLTSEGNKPPRALPPPTRAPRAPPAHQHRPKKIAARPPGRPAARRPGRPLGGQQAHAVRAAWGPTISPPTVEKLGDSCGAGAKKPAVPSTCRRRSKTAQSIVWPIPGALIHRPKGDCGTPADASHRPVHLSQHSVDKHEDRMRAARLFPCTSSTCKGWSRKAQTHSPRRQVVPGKCG
jgi:hypothetical protein